jgi:hypothetical protein
MATFRHRNGVGTAGTRRRSPDRGHAVLLAVFSAACVGPHAPSAAFDYRSQVGIALLKAGSPCLDIRNARLAPGDRVRFVTASTPQAIGDAEVAGRTNEPCAPADPGAAESDHYTLKVVSGSLVKGAPAFALVNALGALTARADGVEGDIDGDGQPESFRFCTSAEGVHLSVWTGRPLEGRRRWHHYYYLGFDVTPDCTERDTLPDPP